MRRGEYISKSDDMVQGTRGADSHDDIKFEYEMVRGLEIEVKGTETDVDVARFGAGWGGRDLKGRKEGMRLFFGRVVFYFIFGCLWFMLLGFFFLFFFCFFFFLFWFFFLIVNYDYEREGNLWVSMCKPY